MGSFSRGIANIATFGAVAKVDEAADSYRRTVAQYNEYKNSSNDIKRLEAEIKNLQDYLDKKAPVIRKIYKNPKTRERLSAVETKALQEYKSCANNIASAPDFSTSAFGYDEDWEDTDVENMSLALASFVMPFGIGALAAHGHADDKVAEIQQKEREVIAAIKKIKPHVLQMEKAKEQYKLAIKTLSTVKSLVERFEN